MEEQDRREIESGSTGEEFPAGMKVLVVDDNPVCLQTLCQMLRLRKYDVTPCGDAQRALQILREKPENFNLVISDIQMPDMDGFKLLEHIGLEMDLPVLMTSGDTSMETVKKATIHGACDFIPKPVKTEMLEYIWRHVFRRKNTNNDNKNNDNNESKNKSDANETASRSVKRKEIAKKDENGEETGEDGSKKNAKKKAKRFQWNDVLHNQFLDAVSQLGGVNGAVPKKILGIMNIPGLTREHVASHLQKYRQIIQKMEKAQEAHNSQHLTSQQVRTLNAMPHSCRPYSKPSSLLTNRFQMQNSINTPLLLENSTNIPLSLLQQQQQQQQHNNLLINQNDFKSAQLGYNNNNQIVANNFTNGLAGFGSGMVGFFNNGGNINNVNNGNELMGVIKTGSMPTRHGVDNMGSPSSNLTYSNNCGKTLNNLDWFNGQI